MRFVEGVARRLVSACRIASLAALSLDVASLHLARQCGRPPTGVGWGGTLRCRPTASLRSRLSDLSNLSASISQPSPLWGLPYDTVFLKFTRKTHPAYIYPVPQSPARRRQLDYLAELTAGKEKVLVCGDFNTFGGSKELVDFQRKSHLVSANIGHLPTNPARHPVKELDYIMHSQDLHLKNFRVIRFPGSDHLPLLAEFAAKRTR